MLFPFPRFYAKLAMSLYSALRAFVPIPLSLAPFIPSKLFAVAAFSAPIGCKGVRGGTVGFPFAGAWVGVVGMLGCDLASVSQPESRSREGSAGPLLLRWGLEEEVIVERGASCNLSCFPCVGTPDFWTDGLDMGFWLLPDMSGVCCCEVGERAFATSGYIGVVRGLLRACLAAVSILGWCDPVDYLPLAVPLKK